MKEHFVLKEGEKIVFKVTNVSSSFWSSYSNNLIVTNIEVIFEKFGTFGNFKGIERYDYKEIKQAIIGKASNGDKQLEIYIGEKKKCFSLQSNSLRELKVLELAINDQMSDEGYNYDAEFYQRMLKPSIKSVEYIENNNSPQESAPPKKDNTMSNFAQSTVKKIISGKKINPTGFVKGAVKAGLDSTSIKKAKDIIFDDLGIYDIQDSFIDVGNDFREMVGLEPKMTNEERLKLEKKQQRKKHLPHKRTTRYTFEEQLQIEREKVKNPQKIENIEKKKSINSQIETLKELKKLLDEGILTQEEFENKKKEVLND